MSNRKLGTLEISISNLRHRIKRTITMIFFVFLLSFALFICISVSISMKYGIESASDRMGADIILVPENYINSVENALFLGEPCTLYFKQDWMDKLTDIKGIRRTSSQLFLASLKASCCDNAIQLIAFNPSTDFTIQPWIRKKTTDKLSPDEVIIGYNLDIQPGSIVRYFGKEFHVKERLDQSGMGYDNCVFLNYSALDSLLATPEAKDQLELPDREKSISLINIDLEAGYEPEAVAREINNQYGSLGITAYTTNHMLYNFSSNIKDYTLYSYILIFLVFLVVIGALSIMYSISLQERKRELGIFIVMGATKQKIFRFISLEALIIGLIGGIAGSIIAKGILILFGNLIKRKIQVPYLQPTLIYYFGIFLITIFCSVITSFFSSFFSSIVITREEGAKLIKENE